MESQRSGPEIVAVPGQIRVLDEDVPWVRDQVELDEAWADLLLACKPLVVDGRIDRDRLSGQGLALVGRLAAARWTMGGEGQPAPMTNHPEPVTGHAIRRQLAMAERLMTGRGADWETATGVVSWLLWVTGASEDLPATDASVARHLLPPEEMPAPTRPRLQ